MAANITLSLQELTGAYRSYGSFGSTGRILKFFANKAYRVQVGI